MLRVWEWVVAAVERGVYSDSRVTGELIRPRGGQGAVLGRPW